MFIALLFLSIYFFYHFSIRQKSDYLALLVWLIPLSYLIAVFQGVSVFLSLQGFYLSLMYAAMFLFGFSLSNNRYGRDIMANGILLSGYVIVMFGLFAWLGYFNIHGVVDLSGVEPRLTSVFTYANTYAGFLVAIIIGSIYISASSAKWWVTWAHSLFLVPSILSLLLTLSRGGWLFLPLLFLVCLLFMRFKVQLTASIILLVSGLGAVALSALSTTNGLELQKAFQQPLALKTWGMLLGVSVLAATLAVLSKHLIGKMVQRLHKPDKQIRFSTLWFPLLAVALSLLLAIIIVSTPLITLLPDTLEQRVKNINFEQHSVIERGYFYLDSYKIFSDHVLFGAGGGGWSALYQSYQSYPYSSRQAHNFFFQTLIDVGLFGSVIVFAFIVAVFYLYIRSIIKHGIKSPHLFLLFIIATALLGHSFIDFDMSYAFISSLLYLCLGGMLAAARTELQPKTSAPADSSNKYKWIYPAALGVLSVTMIVISLQMYMGHNKAVGAIMAVSSSQGDFEQIQSELKSAESLHPTNTDYQLYHIKLLNQGYLQTKQQEFITHANSIFQKMENHEPRLIEAPEYRYTWAIAQENLAEAEKQAALSLQIDPWNQTAYERLITLNSLLGENARLANDTKTALQYWDRAIGYYEQVVERIAKINTVPKSIAIPRSFQITRDMAISTARIQYVKGSYAQTSAILQPFLNDNLDDPGNLEAARYYAASLTRQGKDDAGWSKKLTDKDPNERAVLDRLLGLTPLK